MLIRQQHRTAGLRFMSTSEFVIHINLNTVVPSENWHDRVILYQDFH